MAVTIKSEKEIALMREAGKILAKVHQEIEQMIAPGITTMQIDSFARERMEHYQVTPSFLGYEGYPAAVCVSVNDEVVHGIPKAKRVLKSGDIVSVDAGVIYRGYQSDAARTHLVGEVSDEIKQLVQVTKESFYAGISMAKAGNHLNDISAAIENYVKPYGYGIVKELCGHGIGTSMHEDPQIPNFAMRRKGIRLVKGMTLAIEPMINLGTESILWMADGWTVTTRDHLPSAHYENTILITDGEPEILSIL